MVGECGKLTGLLAKSECATLGGPESVRPIEIDRICLACEIESHPLSGIIGLRQSR